MAVVCKILAVLLTALSVLPAYGKRLVEKLPPVSEIVTGYASADEVRQRRRQAPLHAVEGSWQFPSTGAVVAIELDESKGEGGYAVRYRMVIIKSPQRTIRPGTVMGIIAPTAKKNVYAAEIYTSGNGGTRLRSPRGFTLTLADNAHLSFTKNSGLKVYTNLFRLIPYLSRVSFRIYSQQHAPRDLDGCLRVYPVPVEPVNPIYL